MARSLLFAGINGPAPQNRHRHRRILSPDDNCNEPGARRLGSVRYHVGGEGEPLLLLHGLAGSTRNWVEVLPGPGQALPRRCSRFAGPCAAPDACREGRPPPTSPLWQPQCWRRRRGRPSSRVTRSAVSSPSGSHRAARARAWAAARLPGRDRQRDASAHGARARLHDDSAGPAGRSVPASLRRAHLVPAGPLPAVVRLRRRRAHAPGDARPARRAARAHRHEDGRPRDGRRRSAPRLGAISARSSSSGARGTCSCLWTTHSSTRGGSARSCGSSPTAAIS